jgi:diguanylate cyclase (GGDEF)-like protein
LPILGLKPEDLAGQTLKDLLHLPTDHQGKLSAVTTEPMEVVIRQVSGEKHELELRLSDLRAAPEVQGFVVNARDISERKALERRLRHQALHDPLTDLPNRRTFQLRFAEASAMAAVLFLDLDGFKLVNDSLGHQAGDRLLLDVAKRIRACLQADDVLARQGGDEFLILLNTSEPKVLAERLLAALEPPFRLGSQDVFISASIGIVAPIAGLKADEAVQQADIAMYRAKRLGKARAVFFEASMAADAPERLKLETDFRRAFERREFEVHYQPKVNLVSGKIESLEALVRWRHPERGLVSPGVFIPLAEETGLISQLGKFILETACYDAARWQESKIVMAVNLSPLQFRNPQLVDEVRAALETSALDPALLELEITESAVLGDVEVTIQVLEQLKALGVRLAIDDFGTGYSNLAHLKHFKVDVLKIDQSFIRGTPPGTEQLSDSAIVQAVIAMAKAFGLNVVAEGVETASHARELRDLGCDLGQGYFFSKPVDQAQMSSLLAKENSL